jgi:small subunit ribosomal protein S18
MSDIINNEPTEEKAPEAQAEAPAEQQAAPASETPQQAAPSSEAPQQAAPATPAPQADGGRPPRTDYRDRPRGGPGGGGGGRRGSFYESRDRGGDRESGGGDQGPRMPRFKKKVCSFCQDKNLPIDYKRQDILERFVTDRGKILPRRVTGTCSRHQRIIAREIKRARIIALLPFVEQ